MTNNSDVNNETLERAREYVKQLELGNSKQADLVLGELTEVRESQLFNELGRLTRDFHEAINAFNTDDRMASMASDEIPDARERLTYVITKTDAAAHTTLNAVETALPICESMDKTLADLNEAWEKFLSKEMGAAEFRKLSATMHKFFSTSTDDLTAVKANLTEILMAQDFQDITGQIIKRVITLVSEVEKSLVELVRLGSGLKLPTLESDTDTKKEEKESEKSAKAAMNLEGPQVPGLESDSIVNSQDDVDDLLSSLGF